VQERKKVGSVEKESVPLKQREQVTLWDSITFSLLNIGNILDNADFTYKFDDKKFYIYNMKIGTAVARQHKNYMYVICVENVARGTPESGKFSIFRIKLE